jgi:hypothetical protein
MFQSPVPNSFTGTWESQELFQRRNLFQRTSFGTNHRNSGSLCSTKENCFFCSYVPRLSYILKEIYIKGKRYGKRLYARIREFLITGTTR